MANDLTLILPKIIARVLKATRPAMSILPLISRDWSNELANKGDVINVPISVPMTAQDVSPTTAAAPTPVDVTPTTHPITLDKHKHIAFALTDKDLTQIDANENFLPGQAEEALIGLFTQMTADVMNEYKKAGGFSGIPGTTPFASDASIVNEAWKFQTDRKTPTRNRRIILDTAATEAAKNLSAFSDISQAGSSVKTEGLIGRKLGYDFYEDQQVPLHKAGTLTGSITVSGAHSAGATSVTLATGAGESIALLDGDIITFAGDTTTYAVRGDLTVGASSSGAVTISPGLSAALSGGEAVAVKGDHRVNLAFAPAGFALAIRSLGGQAFTGGNIISEMTDPETGMVARAEIMRANKMTVWDFDVLYGVGSPRPEFIQRIAG